MHARSQARISHQLLGALEAEDVADGGEDRHADHHAKPRQLQQAHRRFAPHFAKALTRQFRIHFPFVLG